MKYIVFFIGILLLGSCNSYSYLGQQRFSGTFNGNPQVEYVPQMVWRDGFYNGRYYSPGLYPNIQSNFGNLLYQGFGALLHSGIESPRLNRYREKPSAVRPPLYQYMYRQHMTKVQKKNEAAYYKNISKKYNKKRIRR